MESEKLGELAAALAKAQGEIKGAVKDATNPFFKSSYADLSSVWGAIREPLSKNALAVVQTVIGVEESYFLKTMLIHSSGAHVSGEIPILTVKKDMQSLGSAITYARRYGLMAIVGVSPLDDDGEGAMGKTSQSNKAPSPSTKSNDWNVYVVPFGKFKGKAITQIDELALVTYASELEDYYKKEKRAPYPEEVSYFFDVLDSYLSPAQNKPSQPNPNREK